MTANREPSNQSFEVDREATVCSASRRFLPFGRTPQKSIIEPALAPIDRPANSIHTGSQRRSSFEADQASSPGVPHFGQDSYRDPTGAGGTGAPSRSALIKRRALLRAELFAGLILNILAHFERNSDIAPLPRIEHIAKALQLRPCPEF